MSPSVETFHSSLSILSEYGAITAGLIGSSLMGIFYLSPFVIFIMALKKKNIRYHDGLFLIALTIVGVTISVTIQNEIATMVTTSMLGLTTLFVSAIAFGNLILRIIHYALRGL